MSYLEKLLEGAAVEWKALWEVTTWDKKFNAVDNYKQPKTIKYHHLLSNEIKPLILEEGNVKLLTTNETDFWTSEELAGSRISNAEIVAIPWGGNVVVQYYKGKFLTGDNRIAVSNDKNCLNTKYLYYFLKNNIILLSSFYRGSGIKHPSMSNVLDLTIPIPPLAVQKEIVRILDTFSELTTELTAELSARKKQYSYYREQFLNFEEDEVEWKRLGEVITLQRGKRLVKSQLEETGEYAVYQNAMTPLGYYHESNVIANTTFVICAGAAGEIGFSDVPYWAADDVHSCITPDGINNKYLYYYLQTQQHKISSQVRRASVPRLSKGVLDKLKFPIPSLEEQNRIVSILDKFNIFTNSLCEGLPREIELRKKQYEYYRDMLLTFPKQESV